MKNNKTWGLVLAIIVAALLPGCAEDTPKEDEAVTVEPATETVPDAPATEEAPAKDSE